jgi:hypothetical protein
MDGRVNGWGGVNTRIEGREEGGKERRKERSDYLHLGYVVSNSTVNG